MCSHKTQLAKLFEPISIIINTKEEASGTLWDKFKIIEWNTRTLVEAIVILNKIYRGLLIRYTKWCVELFPAAILLAASTFDHIEIPSERSCKS